MTRNREREELFDDGGTEMEAIRRSGLRTEVEGKEGE